MMHHNAKFGNKMFGGSEYIIWTNINILTLCCDLDCGSSNPIFIAGHSGLWQCIIRPMFGCQGVNSWENIAESHISIIGVLTVILTMKTATKIQNKQQQQNLHNPLSHDVASPYQVWSQNIQWFRRYHLDKHSLTLWTFAVTLTLDAVIQFFHETLRLMMLYYHTKFGCKQTSSLKDIVKIVIFWLYMPLLWPWHW